MTARLASFAAVAALVLQSCGSGSNSGGAPNQNEPAIKTASLVDPAKVPKRCGDEGLTADEIVGVNKEFDLRTGPSHIAKRIINEKATSILGKTQFHEIDPTTTVRRLCHGKNWSEVQIVEPDWLNFVRGWAPNDILRQIEHDKTGRRVYEVRDFVWDEDTSGYKPQIVAAVNKIVRENDRCASIDPGTVSKSPKQSRPGQPVFFVTCNVGASAFNVWFKPSDVTNGRVFRATPNIAQGPAVDACEAAVKSAATHPSTVSFSRIMDLSFDQAPSGRSQVLSTFTAKNSFGLELKYRVSCIFDGYLLVETAIAEDS